jgi:hypothetical protein
VWLWIASAKRPRNDVEEHCAVIASRLFGGVAIQGRAAGGRRVAPGLLRRKRGSQ